MVAVQAGTVNELRYRSLGGNSFHLTNDLGDYFYYAHLLRYAAGIENGSVVEAGQVLGYVGNTGNAITTPPHLHFEIIPAVARPSTLTRISSCGGGATPERRRSLRHPAPAA